MRITEKRAYAGLILVTSLWGVSFPVMDMCLQHMGAFTLVAIRYFMGAVVLTILALRNTKYRREELKSGILIGIPYAAAAVLQMIGLRQTSVANASFFTGLTVVFVPLIAFALDRIVPSRKTFLGIAFSMVGVVFMSGIIGNSVNQGDIWVLAGCIAFSIQIYHLEKYGKGKNAVALTCVVLWTVFFLICPLAIGMEKMQIQNREWSLILALLFIGVICTAAGIYVQNKLQPCVPSSKAAVIYLLEPVTATLFAFCLGDSLLVRQIIGGSIILAGAWIIIRDTESGMAG